MTKSEFEQPLRTAWRLDPNRGVAKVIGEDVRKHGRCCLGRPTIARLAGVGKTSVDKFLHQLLEHGMIEIEIRPPDQPSIITIASPTWLAMFGARLAATGRGRVETFGDREAGPRGSVARDGAEFKNPLFSL